MNQKSLDKVDSLLGQAKNLIIKELKRK